MRFKSVVCCDLLLKRKEGEKTLILLMKEKKAGNEDGKYDLPGGHLEENEDIFDAMIRETKEELLIDLDNKDLKLIYLMHHYTKERLNFIFEADGSKLSPLIGEPNKCSELKWVDIEKIPRNISKKVKKIIKDILDKKTYNKM